MAELFYFDKKIFSELPPVERSSSLSDFLVA